MSCKLKDVCENCCCNPEAYLEDGFEWNREGKEPTREELDDALVK